MDGRPTPLPSKWVLGGVPERGTVACFFVRSRETAARVLEQGAADHTRRRPPPGALSPFVERYLAPHCLPGTGCPIGASWTHEFTCRRIRHKFSEKFERAEAAARPARPEPPSHRFPCRRLMRRRGGRFASQRWTKTAQA
jgi:hypothetical protein